MSARPSEPDGRCLHVIHGVYAIRYPLSEGETVRQVRQSVSQRMDIPAAATAVVDGQPVGEETVLEAEQVLNFVRPSGVIG